MDNEATGTHEYESYWQSMHEAWRGFDEKSQAKLILSNVIEQYSTRTVHEHYPFAIKIIELCAIGRRKNLTDDHKKVASTHANSEGESTMQGREAIMGRPDTDEKSQRDVRVVWSAKTMKACVYTHKQFMGKNKEEVSAIWCNPSRHGSNQKLAIAVCEYIVKASDYEMKVLRYQGKKGSDELKEAKKRVSDDLRRKGYYVLNKR